MAKRQALAGIEPGLLGSQLCRCAKHSSANRQVFTTRFLVYTLVWLLGLALPKGRGND